MMHEADTSSDGKVSYEVTTKQSFCTRGHNGEMRGKREGVLL